MRIKFVILGVAAVGFFALVGAWYVLAHRIVHQRPYRWDQYYIGELHFKEEPMINVVAAVNQAVAKASHGVVTQAVVFDITPESITKFASNPAVEAQMDGFIADFRRSEPEFLKQHPYGYETAPCTGEVGGYHSIGCALREYASMVDIRYDERPDAIHMSRSTEDLECRAYLMRSDVASVVEQKLRTFPCAPAGQGFLTNLCYVATLNVGNYMKPNGDLSAGGENRFADVLRYLPESNLLLVIGTPEEQSQTQTRLAEAGFLAGQQR